ncbi:MAG: condensation domain-containing protein, partial [Gammaproteobacteria bacterium]|nr:condensation domain-containing protein [Gammaproteobacteria bacterium]
GKLDRASLPKPDREARLNDNVYIAPVTELEKKISAIWSTVLGVDSVGLQDNFFDLGGNSLLVTQLAARVRREFKINVSMHVFFQNPVLSSLSKNLEATLDSHLIQKELPSINIQQKSKYIPLSFSQQRLWFLDQILPVKTAYNISIGWEIEGGLNINALKYALDSILVRHDILRANMKEVDGDLAQIVNDANGFVLEQFDFVHLSEKQKQTVVNAHINEEASTVFHLENGPLFRGRLIKLNATKHILLLSVHHIVSDGWSTVVLEKELNYFYNSYLGNRPTSLPNLPIQYTDFAIWQHDLINKDHSVQQLAYWKAKLENCPDVLSLPTDRTRPRTATYKGGLYSCALSSDLVAAVSRVSKENNATLFMTLLSVFYTLLYRYSGQEDIVIGSPIANRRYIEIENLIGFFANTLALRIRGSLDERFIDLLAQVKTMALEAYEHQDVPFEQLVDHLQITRDLSRNPVFQVMFAFQKLEDNAIKLQDLTVKHLELNYQVSKFDLTLWVQEGYEGESGLRLGFEYATDLFEASTIERMAQHFERL